MWINGDGGATTRNVDSDGVLHDGLRTIQTEPAEWQPEKPVEPVLHLSRASLPREHGPEAEAHKDSHLPRRLRMIIRGIGFRIGLMLTFSGSMPPIMKFTLHFFFFLGIFYWWEKGK